MADKSFEPGGVNVSLDAVALGASVTGTSFGLPVRAELRRNFTWSVDYAAAPTAPDIRLQGSLDDVQWADLDSYTGTTDTVRHVADKPVRFIRAFITAGSATNVTVKIAA